MLDGVDVVVGPGLRLAVVGPNGVGKSTLLRILAGRERPDAGTVRRAPVDLTVGYLDQEHDAGGDETVRHYLARRTGVARAEAEVDRLAAELERGGRDAAAYADALDRWAGLGGADFDVRAAEATEAVGLGGAGSVLDLPATGLSGGQAARLRLAAIVLARHGVLLLDEPTNDLDFQGLDLLERFLASSPAGVVVVSHDRAFLERTVGRVLEIDEHDRRGRLYDGGWATYVEERERARRRQYEQHGAWVTERDRLRQQATRHRGWEATGFRRLRQSGESDKFVRWGMAKGAESQAGRAKRAERALERLEERRVDKPWEGWDLHLDIAPRRRSGDVVVRLVGAVLARGAFRLGPVDLEIGWRDRVAVVGANGSGKTTLLDGLLGRSPVVEGQRWIGPGVVMGDLDQSRQRFSTDALLLDAFAAGAGMLPQEARTVLAKFDLGADDVARAGRSLSPGERSRAQLALLSATGVNCLVLDEPTNHLDLPAIEQLEGVLDRYPGTVVLITHDRCLLDRFAATTVIDVEALPRARAAT